MDQIDSQVLEVFKTNLAVSDAGERKNWFNASELDISPPLQFYGFRLTRHHHAGTTKYYNLQKIIISDAYDSSLSEYYKKKRESHVLSPSPTLTLSHHSASSSSSPGSSSASPSIGLDTNDLNIAAQIWAILNKVHKNALGVAVALFSTVQMLGGFLGSYSTSLISDDGILSLSLAVILPSILSFSSIKIFIKEE